MLLVPSTMGPIKVQVQWARRGGGAALYLLDGMMARNDWNAWSHTVADGQGGNAMPIFGNDNITLVMPVGGESSFYTDWYGPSNFNGQQVTYKWETFLTRELPAYLANYGVNPSDNGIVGLSMGGSAALAMAAYHHNQFKFAATFSGAINLSAPGARTFFRLALLDKGGYNIDSMWGPPWSPAWSRNDPFTFAPKLAGISLFIASGDGVPEAGDFQMNPLDLVDGVALEMLANVAAKSMEIRLESSGDPRHIRLQLGGHPLVGVLVGRAVAGASADPERTQRQLTRATTNTGEQAAEQSAACSPVVIEESRDARFLEGSPGFPSAFLCIGFKLADIRLYELWLRTNNAGGVVYEATDEGMS